MAILRKLLVFIQCLFRRLFRKRKTNNIKEDVYADNELLVKPTLQEAEKTAKELQNYEKANLERAQTVLLAKLYAIQQEIFLFEKDFPKEYEAFQQRIDELRTRYLSSMEEAQKELTFEIDPDTDTVKIGEVAKLEREVREFLEKEVKYNLLAKQLQKLIVKLNILYNVSIFHRKDDEKEKVLAQVERACQKVREIAQEVKNCSYVLADKRLSSRTVDLLTYADYLVFKIKVRNNPKTPGDGIEGLVILTEFEGIDYAEPFKSFLKDELYDLGELSTKIGDEERRRIFKEKIGNLLVEFTYANCVEEKLWDPSFWKSLLEVESSLLEMLKAEDAEQELAKVKLIARMDIRVEEEEVLISPADNAVMELTLLFSTTQEETILLLLKLLKNMSNEVTYKEVYFLAVLFDAMHIVQNEPNKLWKHLKKYTHKYPYTSKEIREKQRTLRKKGKPEYVVAFDLDSHARKIIDTLQRLEMDFRVVGGKVLLNSFYFSGMNQVLESLKKNS